MAQSRNIILVSIVSVALVALSVLWAGPQKQPGPSGGLGTKAVIQGTVYSTGGSPLHGIRVKAEQQGKNYVVSIFTDGNGQYEFPPLPLGQYKVFVGSAWQEDVNLASSGASQDFKVQLGPAFFEQTTGVKWLEHLPGSEREKKLVLNTCARCHSLWKSVEQSKTTLEGWQATVRRMATLGAGFELPPEDFELLTNYLHKTFTPTLKREKFSENVILRPTGEAARGVFIEWSIPAEYQDAFGARPDSKGIVWFIARAHPGENNGIGRLDPMTGDMKIWRFSKKGGFHDILLDKEEHVWVVGAAGFVKFDTKKHEFTSWDIPERFGTGGHTHDFDPDGNVWSTMSGTYPAWVVKLDPRSGEIEGFEVGTHMKGTRTGPSPYGLVIDRKGTVWYTLLWGNRVGKIDRKTSKVTEYAPPTPNSGTRRIQVDSKGKLWLTQFFADKIAMFDPETEKFKEFDIPVPGRPYLIKVDHNDKIWFNHFNEGTIGKFDPDTKQFTFFPFPVPEGRAIDAGFLTDTDPFSLVYGGTHAPVVGLMYVR